MEKSTKLRILPDYKSLDTLIKVFKPKVKEWRSKLNNDFLEDKHLDIVDYNVEHLVDEIAYKMGIPDSNYKVVAGLWTFTSITYMNSLYNSFYKEVEAAYEKGASDEDIEISIDYMTREDVKEVAERLMEPYAKWFGSKEVTDGKDVDNKG